MLIRKKNIMKRRRIEEYKRTGYDNVLSCVHVVQLSALRGILCYGRPWYFRGKRKEYNMLFLLLSVTVLVLLLCGAGCLLGRMMGFNSARNPWIYFWIGFFIVSTLVMFASLFVPVTIISLIIFFVLGAAGLPFFYREYKQVTTHDGEIEIKIIKYVVFIVLLCTIFHSAQAEWPGWAYDTDLYQAQTIRWYNEYGTPPGLGNLHARLAFNSSWHSLAALFDNGPWDNRSAWLMPALAMLGGFLYFLHELVFTRHNGVKLYSLCILVWLVLVWLVLEVWKNPSLYYDDPAHILNAIVVLEAYYLLSGYTNDLSKKEIQAAANLLMLSVSAFMIKPIGAVSLGFSGLLVLFLLIQNTKQAIFPWIKIGLPAFCALGIWVAKNIFLSGYILYPMHIFALPFDWTMTPEAVKMNLKAVLGWNRMPGPDYLLSLKNGFWFWFKPWLARNLRSAKFIKLVVLPSCLSVLFWFFAVRQENRRNIKKAAYFLVWSLCAIVYWFIAVPDMRFGAGFFWVCLGTAFLFAVPAGPHFDLSGLWKRPRVRIAFFYFWGLSIALILGLTRFSKERSFLTIGRLPARPVKEYTVDADPPFSVWLPVEGDRTGNSPLPSTPYTPGNLEMREPGNLGKGFRTARR